MVAFGTVIYPEGIIYFEEFINSINSQIDKNFDLIIINDNVDINTLSKYTSELKVKYIIFNCFEKRTPADLRVDLLMKAKAFGYDLLILGDFDDIFDKKRVLEIKKSYIDDISHAFFYNKLLLFDKSDALKALPAFTNDIDGILECNYLGLSNTAINLSYLSNDFIQSLYGCTSFVFDWYLFSRIICNGGKGKYVDKAITYYRIYNNNFAGVSDRKQIEKEFEVKKNHYKLMEKFDDRYKVLLDALLKIDIKKLTDRKTLSYWWNNIKLFSEGN